MALEHILTDGSETGSSAALKINNGFAQTDVNQTNVDVINDNIVTINTNIATNTADIATNTADIVTINNKIPFTPSYNHSIVNNITVASDTYENINTLNVSGLEPGTYSITLSMIFNIDSITDSAYFKFSTDGGTTYTEVRRESKDITDKIPMTHIFTEVLTESTKVILVDSRKGNVANTLTILSQEIALERKL